MPLLATDRKIQRLFDFVIGELSEMRPDLRMDFTVMILRYLDPEIQELKRRLDVPRVVNGELCK